MANRVQQVKELVKTAGVFLVDGPTVSGSGHLKARVRRAGGEERTFVFSRTPSDRRADLNALSNPRGFARGH